MLTKIIAQLKTGNIKNVVAFGVATMPSTPYVVVKPAMDPLGRGRLIQIFAHFAPGSNLFLEDYIVDELPTLLKDFHASTRHGNTQQVQDLYEYEEVVTENDDKSISMKRTFLVPGKVF